MTASSRALFDDPVGINPTEVECPTCDAWKGWACGTCHADGSHRTRIRAVLRQKGFVEVMSTRRYGGNEFVFDLLDGYYYDLVPGYRAVYVRRERGAWPLNYRGER